MYLQKSEHNEYREVAAQYKKLFPSVKIFENNIESKTYTIEIESYN